MVSWNVIRGSRAHATISRARRFVVNVLAEAQVEVSRRFASPQADKFEGVPHAENAWGLPLLHGASAWFECRTVSRQIAGDHCLFIAEVERFTLSEAAPLLFHAGGYFALGSRL